jgi:pimeloyl-ACP methyl ester carboxylesterase
VIVSETSRKIDLETHALRVREAGGGDTTFVCLHGFLEDASSWTAVASALADAGRVICVQQRAQGDSTAPGGPCTLDDLSRDVAQLLDAMGVGRAILIGHGLGGLTAAKVALTAPQRVGGLVLVAAFSELDVRAAAAWRHHVRAGEVSKLQGLARSVFGPTSTRQVDGDGIALTEIARALQTLGDHPVTAQLAAITCPTVVLAGERDAAASAAARRIAATIPGARLEIVPQQGEDLPAAAADVVARAARALAG